MDRPRVLIIGKNGQVGWELRRTLAPLGEVVAVDYPEIDFSQADSLRNWMREVRPRIVVNAAAYTAVDKAEKELDLAAKINALAPGILAEEAKRLGALLVHYSTDYVYDGAKREPYVETDATGPLSAYGRTKLDGDLAVQQVDGAHLIFRLCWVYGARGQNFMLTMMRLAREREQLRVVSDQFGSPTWSRMIAATTTLAVQQLLGQKDFNGRKGVYHLCSSGHTSWHQFADQIVRLMPEEGKKCRQVDAITTADYPTPARRPAYSVLSCDKLKHTFGLVLPTWEDSLRMVLDKQL
ncbi:MAG: dTDP-4-dehydrorhamnose reductase [Verrucomicrobiota bacterium]